MTVSYSEPIALWIVVAYARSTLLKSSTPYSSVLPAPKSMPIFLPWSVSLIYRMKPRSPLETFSVFLVCMMRSLTRKILGPNLISSSAERNGLTNSRMVSFSCSDDAAPSERKGERICTFSMPLSCISKQYRSVIFSAVSS